MGAAPSGGMGRRTHTRRSRCSLAHSPPAGASAKGRLRSRRPAVAVVESQGPADQTEPLQDEGRRGRGTPAPALTARLASADADAGRPRARGAASPTVSRSAAIVARSAPRFARRRRPRRTVLGPGDGFSVERARGRPDTPSAVAGSPRRDDDGRAVIADPSGHDRVTELTKRYGDTLAVDDTSFTVRGLQKGRALTGRTPHARTRR